jgi:hypothetical protein
MADFKFIRPHNPFIVCNTGVQIAGEARCEHGQPAILISLLGDYLSRPRTHAHERLDTVLPRCVIAELLGTLQSQIRRTEGDAALQEFLDDIAEHTAAADTAMNLLHAQARDCCEAGFRTHGREHTCGRNDVQEVDRG